MRRALIPAIAGIGVFLALLAAARPTRPDRGGPSGAIAVEAASIALDPTDPAYVQLGRFAYGGGLQLTSPDTSLLHGVSDLKVWPDGRLLAVTDAGDLLEARLQLDDGGRLQGIAEARLTALPGPDGQPANARGKAAADAEGVAQLANGDRLVSFESDDRIWRYPAAGGPPVPAPQPDVRFPRNFGMEALADDPEAGPDAYVVGGEVRGRTWRCRLSSGCADGERVSRSPLWGLTAVAPLPGGRTAWLLRGMSTWFGYKAQVRIVGADGRTIDELALGPPLNTDNFEGLAAVPQADGGARFYLVSDDNFAASQRTLLLAFDWTPPDQRQTDRSRP